MKRKFIGILLVVALVATLAFGLIACNKSAEDKYTIVYLGDSIAEALIGPSPLSERDNYGYYALVGRTNDFNYYNHSVSGHKTSTGIVSNEGLLEVIKRDDENAVLMRTHIQQADMIHISVLGNNVLQYDLGLMMLEVADPDFEEKYEAGKLSENSFDKTLINALEEGSIGDPLYRNSVDKVDDKGNPVEVEFAFPPTYQDISDIVDKLKELNPNATIVFQKVYNPFFEGSKHLSPAVLAKLTEITDDGRFGAEGQPISTIEQVRKLADYLLGKLNGILDKYLETHNGAFKVLDAREAFQNVVEMDKNEDGSVNLSGKSLGRKLIYQDWTHPSNFGHAVIAGMTQELLDEMHVSSPNALANYKAIRIEQINRMFKGIEGFDADSAISAINSAKKYLDVTLAYFKAIDGCTPIIPANSFVTNNGSTSFSSAQRFKLDVQNTYIMNDDFNSIFNMAVLMAVDMDNTFAEFTPDGKMHFQIQTKADLMKLAGSFAETIGSMLSGFDIEGGIDGMVEPMFPGFKAKIEKGDLKGALEIIQNGLGFNITGLDYEDDGIKEILAYVAENMSLPSNLIELIPSDTVLTLTFDSQYYVKDVKGADGKTYKAIYVSHIGANASTQPFCVFDVTTNYDGLMELFFRIEFMNVELSFVQTASN